MGISHRVHFKKEAKRLAADVRTGSEAALGRVAAVYRDAASLGADVGLMRGQHVVAVESGFPSWDALVKATAIELRLVITMAAIPALNDFGIGEFDHGRGLSRAERDATIAKNRTKLRASSASVARVVEWLMRNVAPTKTMSTSGHSYSFKHTAEREIGPYKIMDDSPNVRFGFSARSLRELYERAEKPEKVLARVPALALSVLRRMGAHAVATLEISHEVVWREHGELRGLRFSSFCARPPLVAIDMDNFRPRVSSRVARDLGLAEGSRGTFGRVELADRHRQQFVVTYDELERGLAWIVGGASSSDRSFDVEPATDDPARGSLTWSRQARTMWSLHHA
jgi:hypothetical protein